MRAARWRGMSWEQFDALDGDDQARVVAEYRTEQRIADVQYYHGQPKKSLNHATNGRTTSRRRRS